METWKLCNKEHSDDSRATLAETKGWVRYCILPVNNQLTRLESVRKVGQCFDQAMQAGKLCPF